jgi:putative ABC transport system permease protein
LLSRAKAREREMAVRRALGAARTRLVRQFFIEVLMLALLGAALAALTSRWSVAALVQLGSNYLPDPQRIHADPVVFGFTLALAILAAVLVSLAAAWNATRVNVYETLKESGQAVGAARARVRGQQILVIVQIGAAFLLLIGAGAMIECLAKLSRVDPGFATGHLLTMRLPFGETKYSKSHPLSSFLQPALEKIEASRGVQSAAVITYLPLQSVGTNSTFKIAGKPKPRANEEPWAEVRAISPDYFRTMGIRLLRGRWFNDADGAEAAHVVIVNRTFVKQYLGNEDPLGKQIGYSDGTGWMTIVGVAENTRQGGILDDPRPEADIPYSQADWAYLTRTMTLVVRTSGDPDTMSRTIPQTIYSLDADQGVYGVKSMDQIIAETESDQRFMMSLLEMFAGLALLVAAAGLFGQALYAVSQRTREIAIRMALGASRTDVVRMVLLQSAVMAGIGMLIGFGGSFGLMRLLSSLLYSVTPADPVVLIGAAATLIIAVLAACYIPARRAMRVDPIVALRYE